MLDYHALTIMLREWCLSVAPDWFVSCMGGVLVSIPMFVL